MKNNTTKKTSRSTSILLIILAFGVGWLINANSKLKRENKEKTDKIEKMEFRERHSEYKEGEGKCAGC